MLENLKVIILTAVFLIAVVTIPVFAQGQPDTDTQLGAKESAITVFQWGQFEKALTTGRNYTEAQKYQDVRLNATFVGPDGATYTVPGFWDGGVTWRIRFSPPTAGEWVYAVDSSDVQMDAAANDGRFIARAPSPDTLKQNPNYRGFLRVSANSRYLTYADGAPFFWLGGTAWRGNRLRMAFQPQPDAAGPDVAEFPFYVDNRQTKGFTAVQIRAGFPQDPTARNEGGATFLQQYDLVNPNFFQWFDKRIQYIADQGMVPVITGQWYMDTADMPLDDLQQYWRYLIARYQAYNVIWVISGEYGFLDDINKVDQLGRYVDQVDTTKHLTTVHPTPNPPYPAFSSAEHFGDAPWLDFHLQQTWDQAATRTAMAADYARGTTPSVNAEAGYDGLWGWDREMVRRDAWTVYLSGGAGYTYGANGVFNWNDGCCDDEKFKPPRWYDVIDAPSSYDMQRLAAFFARTRWWELAPDDSLVNDGYALANPGREYVLYVPDPTPPVMPPRLQWATAVFTLFNKHAAITLDLTNAPGSYNLTWFNPQTGEFRDGGLVQSGTPQTLFAPFSQDVVLHLLRD